jgi:hypothetical protein
MDGLLLKKKRLQLDCQLREFDLQLARNEWIRRDAIEAEWRSKLITVKSHFMNLGRTVAPLCCGRSMAEIEAIIRKRIVEILMMLAHSDLYPAHQLKIELHNSPQKEAL